MGRDTEPRPEDVLNSPLQLVAQRDRPVRVPVHRTGRADGNGPLFGEVRDLSRTGLSLSTSRLLPAGTVVTVRFELPFRTPDGERRAVVEVVGEVRRRWRAGDAGVGIGFLRLSRENELVIQEYVERGGCDPIVSRITPG